MNYLDQFKWIVLALLVTVRVTQVHFVQKTYTEVEPGQNITAKLVANLTTESHHQCASRSVKFNRFGC